MALIKCSECKKRVSTKAKYCPNCGADYEAFVSSQYDFKKGWTLGIPNKVWYNWPTSDYPTRFPEEFPLFGKNENGDYVKIPFRSMSLIQKKYIVSHAVFVFLSMFLTIFWGIF